MYDYEEERKQMLNFIKWHLLGFVGVLLLTKLLMG